jgi:hypothetical protein
MCSLLREGVLRRLLALAMVVALGKEEAWCAYDNQLSIEKQYEVRLKISDCDGFGFSFQRKNAIREQTQI